MAMIMENFKHKCDECEKHITTCDATNIFFASDLINPINSILADTILWCGSFVRAEKTEKINHRDDTVVNGLDK